MGKCSLWDKFTKHEVARKLFACRRAKKQLTFKTFTTELLSLFLKQSGKAVIASSHFQILNNKNHTTSDVLCCDTETSYCTIFFCQAVLFLSDASYVTEVIFLCLLLFMSMGYDYISKLWTPTGLLFILQVIHECGEPQWNNIDRGNQRTQDKQPVPVTFCPSCISCCCLCANANLTTADYGWGQIHSRI
jgi:hypothetical protein